MPPISTTGSRRSRRDHASQQPATQSIDADRIEALSANKLRYALFSVSCPECGERRIHNSDGLRRCPGCRTHYFLVASPAGNAA